MSDDRKVQSLSKDSKGHLSNVIFKRNVDDHSKKRRKHNVLKYVTRKHTSVYPLFGSAKSVKSCNVKYSEGQGNNRYTRKRVYNSDKPSKTTNAYKAALISSNYKIRIRFHSNQKDETPCSASDTCTASFNGKSLYNSYKRKHCDNHCRQLPYEERRLGELRNMRKPAERAKIVRPKIQTKNKIIKSKADKEKDPMKQNKIKQLTESGLQLLPELKTNAEKYIMGKVEIELCQPPNPVPSNENSLFEKFKDVKKISLAKKRLTPDQVLKPEQNGILNKKTKFTLKRKALANDSIYSLHTLSAQRVRKSIKSKPIKGTVIVTRLEEKTREQRRNIIRGLTQISILPKSKTSRENIFAKLNPHRELKRKTTTEKYKHNKTLGCKFRSEKKLILKEIIESGIPFPVGREASQNILIIKVKGKPPAPSSCKIMASTEEILLPQTPSKVTITYAKLINVNGGRLRKKTASDISLNGTAKKEHLTKNRSSSSGPRLGHETTRHLNKTVAKLMTRGKGPVGNECFCNLPNQSEQGVTKSPTASHLVTLLELKTCEQKGKSLRGLSVNGTPLPARKPASERKIIEQEITELAPPSEPAPIPLSKSASHTTLFTEEKSYECKAQYRTRRNNRTKLLSRSESAQNGHRCSEFKKQKNKSNVSIYRLENMKHFKTRKEGCSTPIVLHYDSSHELLPLSEDIRSKKPLTESSSLLVLVPSGQNHTDGKGNSASSYLTIQLSQDIDVTPKSDCHWNDQLVKLFPVTRGIKIEKKGRNYKPGGFRLSKSDMVKNPRVIKNKPGTSKHRLYISTKEKAIVDVKNISDDIAPANTTSAIKKVSYHKISNAATRNKTTSVQVKILNMMAQDKATSVEYKMLSFIAQDKATSVDDNTISDQTAQENAIKCGEICQDKARYPYENFNGYKQNKSEPFADDGVPMAQQSSVPNLFHLFEETTQECQHVNSIEDQSNQQSVSTISSDTLLSIDHDNRDDSVRVTSHSSTDVSASHSTFSRHASVKTPGLTTTKQGGGNDLIGVMAMFRRAWPWSAAAAWWGRRAFLRTQLSPALISAQDDQQSAFLIGSRETSVC